LSFVLLGFAGRLGSRIGCCLLAVRGGFGLFGLSLPSVFADGIYFSSVFLGFCWLGSGLLYHFSLLKLAWFLSVPGRRDFGLLLPWAEGFLGRLCPLFFPGPEGRFVNPFSLVFANSAFEGHSVTFNVYLKLEFIILRKVGLELMANLIALLELRDQIVSTDLEFTKLIVLVALTLHDDQ
jgi:hypothetical protein